MKLNSTPAMLLFELEITSMLGGKRIGNLPFGVVPLYPSTHDASHAFGSSSFSSESGSSEDTDALHAFVSTGIRAVAGMGAFLESSGLDHDALANLRGVAMFQLAGRRDSHVTPRAVARLADAMRRARWPCFATARTASWTRRASTSTPTRSAPPRSEASRGSSRETSNRRALCPSPRSGHFLKMVSAPIETITMRLL